MSPRLLLAAGAAAALALFPLVGGKFGVDFVTKMMVFAIFALSLELLVGQVGLVCFGQAAFYKNQIFTEAKKASPLAAAKP